MGDDGTLQFSLLGAAGRAVVKRAIASAGGGTSASAVVVRLREAAQRTRATERMNDMDLDLLHDSFGSYQASEYTASRVTLVMMG